MHSAFAKGHIVVRKKNQKNRPISPYFFFLFFSLSFMCIMKLAGFFELLEKKWQFNYIAWSAFIEDNSVLGSEKIEIRRTKLSGHHGWRVFRKPILIISPYTNYPHVPLYVVVYIHIYICNFALCTSASSRYIFTRLMIVLLYFFYDYIFFLFFIIGYSEKKFQNIVHAKK